jgi:Mg-chelatase subunit ChlD
MLSEPSRRQSELVREASVVSRRFDCAMTAVRPTLWSLLLVGLRQPVKRVVSLLASIALVATALPTLSVQPALAVHNGCTDEDLSESRTSGPVTVEYDDHNLVHPNVDPTGAIAADIAQAVADEAFEALELYADLGFHDMISPAITVKLTCRTVNPFNDQRALVVGPDTVEYPVAQIHNELAALASATPPLAGTDWKTGKYEWVDTLHHEMFHTVQYNLKGGSAAFWFAYYRLAGESLFESSATLAQDWFGTDADDPSVNIDDEGDPGVDSSYAEQLESLLDEPVKPTFVDGGHDYEVGGIFQYWGERYGDQTEDDLEARVAGFVREMTVAGGEWHEPYERATGVDAFEALREFWVAALVRDKAGIPNAYRFLDEEYPTGEPYSAGGPVGTPPSSGYPALRVAAEDSEPLASASFTDNMLREGRGRIYEVIPLPVGTNLVSVTLDTKIGLAEGFDGAAVLTDSSSLYAAAIPADATSAVVGPRNFWRGPSGWSAPQSQIVAVGGYDRLAIVFTAGRRGAAYDLVVTDVSGTPDIAIVTPTTAAPLAIGSPGDLQEFTVVVEPTINGDPVPGELLGSNFQVTVGGDAAAGVEAVAIDDGARYELHVQPPATLGAGFHDLDVTFLGATDIEPDAVITESVQAAVALVIDNSGSMGGAPIAAAKDAAIAFVNGMEFGDQVAVITFNSTATVRHDLVSLTATTRDSVIASIVGIGAGGQTDIGAGIIAANGQLANAEAGYARAQVLLSDGNGPLGTAVQNTPDDIEIHTIALGNANQALLEGVASDTGGTFLVAPAPEDLAELYLLIRAEVSAVETSAAGSLGQLGQGQSATADFVVVDGTSAMRSALRWVGSDFDLTLTSPSGRIIDEDSTDADVTVNQGSDFVTIDVDAPEAGPWQLEVLGVDVPAPEEVSYRIEESGSPIRSQLYVDGDGQAGHPVEMRLLLTEEAIGVPNATVTASVTDPVGVTRHFPLTDDGGQADGRAGDGLYGAVAFGTNVSGSYDIQVVARGIDAGGGDFSRIERASTFLSSLVDADGDGIADGIETAMGLDPADSADGALDTDGDGLSIAEEQALGTDPFIADTDAGGESDGSEAAGGRDPLQAGDDAPFPDVVLAAGLKDGNVVEVVVGTADGTGTVELSRVTSTSSDVIGTFSGPGTTLDDGPLGSGEYWYEATAVSPSGDRGEPVRVGPYVPAADVTPPSVLIIVNEGDWATTNPTVDVEFFGLTEPVAEMRLAESEEDLESAPWVPYANPTTFTIGSEPGVHIVHAQVRDAAGNVSSPATGVIDLAASVVTERVSESSQHGQGNGLSHEAYISADGRYVTFESEASDLVSGDTNAVADVFVHDRVSGTTSRVSVASDATQANGSSEDPTISPDGRFVAFRSAASNLVAGDTNNKYDIFVHDRQTGTTTRVSVTNSGAQATGASDSPVVARDGAAVVFRSFASNLVSGDTNGETDIFVRDLVAGSTTRVSVSSSGAQGNAGTDGPTISDDGRYVAFDSVATTLVAGDTNAVSDVFLHDRSTGTTSRVSLAAGGTQANGASWEASLDADGGVLAFQSAASNLVTGDTNAKDDAFVVTVASGAIVRASVGDDGSQSNNHAGEVSLSADGSLLAFYSTASNLVAGDTNGKGDVFVRDLVNATTTRWSLATDGTQANDRSTNPTIAGAGHTVAFHSFATNLVPNDTNAVADVFVRGPDQ